MYLLVCASTCEEVQYFSVKKLLSGISKNFLSFMQSSHDFCNLMLTSTKLNDLKQSHIILSNHYFPRYVVYHLFVILQNLFLRLLSYEHWLAKWICLGGDILIELVKSYSSGRMPSLFVNILCNVGQWKVTIQIRCIFFTTDDINFAVQMLFGSVCKFYFLQRQTWFKTCWDTFA